MDLYQYDLLDLGRPAIRLVRLLPGSDSDQITCELFQAFLNQEDDIIPYEALSYTWGSAEAPKHIIVNGKILVVTKNLHQALQQLRREVHDRILWIDAICIDQKNEKERGHQVQQMGEIYKQADCVLFYLGESNLEVDTFMDTLDMMRKLSLNYPCRNWILDDNRWEVVWMSAVQAVLGSPSILKIAGLQQGYQDLLKRSWFRRVWILQEAANARAGLVLCGSKTTKPWLLQVVQKLLGITPDDHCRAVLDVMPGPWRNSSWWNRNQDLYTLLSRFGGSEATEPRDLIYALRGMSSDAKDAPNLYPDYTKSEQELIRDAVLFLYPLQNEDLGALPLPMTIHELVLNLGDLGHRIYSKMFGKITRTRKNLDDQIQIFQTQTWKLISPNRAPSSPAERRDLHSPSAISNRLLLAKLRSDDTGDAVALFGFGLSKDNLRTEHLIAAVENIHGAKALEIVLGFADHEFEIVEEVLVLAAKHKDHGDKMMELLLYHPSCPRYITQDVLVSAAKNEHYGAKMMELLLHHPGCPRYVSQDVVVAAKDNGWWWYEIPKILEEHQKVVLPIARDTMYPGY